jgi:hypothetical protein
MPYERVCTLDICISPLRAARRQPRVLIYGREESVGAQCEGGTVLLLLCARQFQYLEE